MPKNYMKPHLAKSSNNTLMYSSEKSRNYVFWNNSKGVSTFFYAMIAFPIFFTDDALMFMFS